MVYWQKLTPGNIGQRWLCYYEYRRKERDLLAEAIPKCNVMKYSDFLREHNDELLDIINCMRVGVWITDAQGTVLMLNDVSEKRGGIDRKELIGRSMEELVDWGYVAESSALAARSKRKEETSIEHIGAGGQILVTSVPLYWDGKMDLIICVERDVKEISDLKEALNQQKEIAEQTKLQLEQFKLELENEKGEFVASSYKMLRVKENVKLVGSLDTTVTVLGESGTGKEMVADLLYAHSSRSDKPFIKVNCAAIPESLIESELFGYEAGAFTGANNKGKPGVFEQADGGTVFLDEIGELPLMMQSKLLRALENGEVRRVGGTKTKIVNVRIIAATNRQLKKAVENGTFREDLYYRLMIVPIYIPPLRERREDIIPLAAMFLEKFNEKYSMEKVFSESAIDELMNYDWPGNVRELRNAVERLTVTGEGSKITGFQVKYSIGDPERQQGAVYYGRGRQTLPEMIAEYEKQIISEAMEELHTVSAAAKSLGIDKGTLSRKLKKYREKYNSGR